MLAIRLTVGDMKRGTIQNSKAHMKEVFERNEKLDRANSHAN